MKKTITAHQRWIKWLLFFTFLITVPVPLYLILALGMVPAAAIILVTLGELANALHGGGVGNIVWIIMGVQVAISGVILYLAARFLARIFCGNQSKGYAILSATVFIGCLIAASSFRIYLLPDHNSVLTGNLVGVVRYFALHWQGSPFSFFFPHL